MLLPRRGRQSGKFCRSSRVGLDMHTKVINRTTTTKKRSCSIWIFPVVIYIISSTFPVEMFIKIAAPVIMQLLNSNQWGSWKNSRYFKILLQNFVVYDVMSKWLFSKSSKALIKIALAFLWCLLVLWVAANNANLAWWLYLFTSWCSTSVCIDN